MTTSSSGAVRQAACWRRGSPRTPKQAGHQRNADFNGAGRAVGVEISRGSRLEQLLRAELEVVLSAGTYGTPHLFPRSGVGPAGALTPSQIGVVHELPVGQQLQDHPLVTLNYLTDEESLMTAMSPRTSRCCRTSTGAR